MDPDSTFIMSHWTVVLLTLFLNILFSVCDTAAVTINDSKLKTMASAGSKRAKTLEKLTAQPNRFLVTMQTGILLTGFLFYASAAPVLQKSMLALLSERFGNVPSWGTVLVLLLTVLLLTFVLLLLGQIIPRRVTMEHAESIALAAAPLLNLCFVLLRPFTALLTLCAGVLIRLFGIKDAAKPENVTEEEIRMMVDAGNETGEIEQTEKDMINSIFEFDDTTVSEVMTHRTEVCALNQHTNVIQAIQAFVESGHSRLPVFDEDIDSIVGFLYAKDMLKLAGNSDAMENIVKVYARPAMFIPESTRCDELMKAFQANKVQIAVVVDEYGGTSGVVTMEDLLETIVGSIQDEYDHEEAESAQISDNCYLLDGALSLDEAERILQVSFASEEEREEYDTLSGLLIHLLDRIPAEWEHPSVNLGSVTFTVLEMEDRFIAKIKAEILLEPLHTEE